LQDTGCGSTLTASQDSCSGGTCWTFSGTADGTYIIMRDCYSGSTSTTCTSVNTVLSGIRIIGQYCFCSTSYCNGGTYYGVAATTPRPSLSNVICYECISLENNGCGTTLSGSQPTCSGATCYTYTGTVDGEYMVGRGCLDIAGSSYCEDINTIYDGSRFIGKFCYCTTSYCNTGSNVVTAPRTTTTTPRPSLTKTYCYECTSQQNAGCGTTLSGSQSTCYATTCYTFIGTVDGEYAVFRGCQTSTYSSGCQKVDTTFAGSRTVGEFCYCSTKLCNDRTSSASYKATESAAESSIRGSPRNQLMVVFVLATVSSMLATHN
jgi:hypothetical protein